jgi:hypothetical protein
MAASAVRVVAAARKEVDMKSFTRTVKSGVGFIKIRVVKNT